MEGKIVIITGASSGIGAGTAVHFARLGANLTLVAQNESKLQNVIRHCQQANNYIEVQYIVADVTKETSAEGIITRTLDKFGKIDVLINNSGIVAVGSIEKTNLKQYDTVMTSNVRSIYNLTSLAVPHLIKTQGSIVNVSSVNGMRAFPGVLAYCISKAAIDQLTRSVALELAPKGVRVNSVNPGVIITEIHKMSGMDDKQYQEFLERTKLTHALGRPGNVKDVAEAIGFLATSSFITGVNLPVDGGRHAMVNSNEGYLDY